MSVAKCAAITAIGLALAACAGDPESGRGPRENTGTLIGGLTGAAIGSQFGGGVGGHLAGVAIGAGLGALIGNRIGAAMRTLRSRMTRFSTVSARCFSPFAYF